MLRNPHLPTTWLFAAAACLAYACETADLAVEPGGDAGSSQDASTEAPIKHASCRQPAPRDLAEPAGLDVAELQRDVNAWTAVSCELATALPTCGPGESCDASTPLCFRADENRSQGVCSVDVRATKGESITMLSYREGRCVVTMRVADKAAACCRKLDGFDCRTYPFGTPSKPGQRCAKHEDCEPGLVCSDSGLCGCPGSTVVVNDPSCLREHLPLPWESERLPDADKGACIPALDGYVAEALDAGRNESVRVAVASDGSFHVFYAHLGANGADTRHATNASGAWLVDVLPFPIDPARAGTPYKPAQVTIDADGFIHLALDGKGLQYATNRSGSWALTQIEAASREITAGLALASDGTPRLAYARGNGGLYVASPGGTGFVTQPLDSTMAKPATRVLALMTADVLHILVDSDGELGRHFVGTTVGFDEHVVAPFEHLDAVTLGETLLTIGSQRSPNGRVELGALEGDKLSGFGGEEVMRVWEQPASRFERVAPDVRVAFNNGLVAATYNTPDGRAVTAAGLDGTTTVQVTRDSSPAEIALDPNQRVHVFVAGSGTLFDLTKAGCPASP